MGLFDQFPYTNFHELNLMWILEALKEIQTTTEQFVAINSLKYADPIQWNITSQYEKNTIVIDPQTGTAYISVQPVPMGVALTNEDYWTVVFNLREFVVRAAKNFTTRFEEDTTLTATFNSVAGDWLVWGDTLYIANVNITAGDSYVVDGNIRRITIEEVKNEIYEIVGNLNNLTTTDKSNLVAAINEVLATLINTTGELEDLNTTDKTNVVAAINELVSGLSNETQARQDADTTLQDNIDDEVQARQDADGNLNNLNTSDKSNLVNAINEVHSMVGGSFVTQQSGSIAKILDSETVVNELYTNLYPTQVFSEYGIGYETEIISKASTDAPETGLAIGIKHHNATSDAVGLWVAADGVQPGCAVFGANIIVTSETVGKMVGLELDYEPADGVTPTDGNSLILNVFNSACPGSHIMIGGVSNGSMANGIIIGNGVRQACVASTYSTDSQWFINSENGSFSDIAIQLGESLSKGIGLRTSTSERAFIYTRGTDFLVRNNAGNLLLGAGSGEQSFIVFSNGLIGTRTATVTTSATAGSATLPSNPVGFLSMDINGTIRKIPFYG